MGTIETLRVIHFDRQRTILAVTEHTGDASNVVLPLRTSIGDALRLGTIGLLLSHNHPSGDPTPSDSDIAATKRLQSAASALGIRVHDHLIFGGGVHLSFRAMGIL